MNSQLEFSGGHGVHLYDSLGAPYLDGCSSRWSCTLGHALPELQAAAREQLERVRLATLLDDPSIAAVDLTELLVPVVPLEDPVVLPAASAVEAIGRAVELAIRYRLRGSPGKPSELLVLGGAAHLLAPGPCELVHTPGYADGRWLAKGLNVLDARAATLGGVMIEPLVQVSAGVHLADPADVATFVDAAQASGIPVICDEVATGFGRTGTLFASEQCLITPDLLCLGGAITGGHLPLAATVVGSNLGHEGLADAPAERAGGIGFDLAAAVVRAHLDLLAEPGLLDRVVDRGDHLGAVLERLTDQTGVGEVRRRGLIAGVQLRGTGGESGLGERVAEVCRANGVLIAAAGDALVVAPPLSIGDSDLDWLATVVGEAIQIVAAGGDLAEP